MKIDKRYASPRRLADFNRSALAVIRSYVTLSLLLLLWKWLRHKVFYILYFAQHVIGPVRCGPLETTFAVFDLISIKKEYKRQNIYANDMYIQMMNNSLKSISNDNEKERCSGDANVICFANLSLSSILRPFRWYQMNRPIQMLTC